MLPLLFAVVIHHLSLLQPSHVHTLLFAQPPVIADGFTQLGTQISTILGEILTMFKTMAPIVAGIGLITIAILYMGSSIPVISTWKQSNPQAFSNVLVGVMISFAVSSIVSFITFT